MTDHFYYRSVGGGHIHGCRWLPEGQVRAVVQIIHGIAEHISRYDAFARYINGLGIAVVAVSAVSAFARWVRVLLTHRRDDIQFRLAAGLALSLEFKMAAEILKTVLVRQLSELVTLGIVIVLRALLSALIHLEMRHYSPKKQSEVHG